MNKFKFSEVRKSCCKNEGNNSYGDCDSAAWPKGTYFN